MYSSTRRSESEQYWSCCRDDFHLLAARNNKIANVYISSTLLEEFWSKQSVIESRLRVRVVREYLYFFHFFWSFFFYFWEIFTVDFRSLIHYVNWANWLWNCCWKSIVRRDDIINNRIMCAMVTRWVGWSTQNDERIQYKINFSMKLHYFFQLDKLMSEKIGWKMRKMFRQSLRLSSVCW